MNEETTNKLKNFDRADCLQILIDTITGLVC